LGGEGAREVRARRTKGNAMTKKKKNTLRRIALAAALTLAIAGLSGG
jgi:hypothetical protein